MNDRMDVSGLAADDARTARALDAAFSAVTLNRPAPVAAADPTDADPTDAETAAALDAAFSAVTLNGPAPAADTTRTSLVAMPSRPHTRSPRWLAVAAAAVGIALAVTLVPGRASVAWAAEPATPTTTDARAAEKSCSAPLSRGLGALEQSGTATVTGTTPRPVPELDTNQPTALPPLAVLDIRGDGAMAVYQDATWQIICLLKRDNATWVDQGISVSPRPSDATPAVVFSGATTWVSGDSIGYLGGTVPVGTSRVTFQLSDDTTVQASVLGTTFAAWYPGDRSIVPGTLSTYDGHGTKLN